MKKKTDKTKKEKESKQYNNVISWECKDIVQTYTAIKFCLLKVTDDALNYRMKNGDSDSNTNRRQENASIDKVF